MANEAYFRYWGKAEKDSGRYHLLPYHCLDVAAVGHIMLSNHVAILNKFASITNLDPSICKQVLSLSLTVHDIGKFSESFQNLRPDLLEKLQSIESNKSYSVRHDSLGNLFFKHSFGNQVLSISDGISFYEWQDVILALIRAFTGHHGKPPEMTGPNGLPLLSSFSKYFSKDDSRAAMQFIRDTNAIFDKQPESFSAYSPYELEEPIKRTSWLLAGFVVLCDWIGSNDQWFHFLDKPMPLEKYWETHALPQAERAIHEAEINRGIPLSGPIGFSKFFPKIKTPTPLQKFTEHCPLEKSQQLFILEDITGSGKTEAALLLAGRLMAVGCGNGIFIALPTMATSNAMFSRLAENPSPDETPVYLRLFEKESYPSIVLAHGARHLSEAFMIAVATHSTEPMNEETASAQCSAWLADNRKKALLANMGVGTIDQALLAVLPARFQSLRLFGLANHILIVDEVHSYDPYMNRLLQNLLSFHAAFGGSAILLSATLPTTVRRDFISAFAIGCNDFQFFSPKSVAYPLATSYTIDKGITETPVVAAKHRRCSVEITLTKDEDEIIRQILEVSGKNKCVCWIRNTVHDAISGYLILKEKLPEMNLTLFHARFAMGDRLDIENRVTSLFGKNSTATERRGKVLVATQVVEQSLDLDFDLLISDLAPMDLLIQRAGRLHRHPRDAEGNRVAVDSDQRGVARMIIHGPMPVDDADANWFKAKFKKAAYVYPSHGNLWLTARLLMEKGELKMPDDARELIEAAFSEKADRIPRALQRRDDQAAAQWQADKSLAHINMLKLDEGYEATITQWREDMKTPTRLGGMDTTVRLARWDGKFLLPWYTDEKFAWDMSQVNINSHLVNAEIEYIGVLGQKISQLKEALPDKGKWSVLIPLRPSKDGRWKGEALNKKQETVVLEYDRLTGITVAKKED